MKKFENFRKALKNLQDIYQYDEPYENVILTGMVSLFEICFEQSWKAMKEILVEQGFAEGKTGSPRQVIKTAYAAGMISEEELWLEALISRNNVAHAYNQDIALDIVQRTKSSYVQMFLKLKDTIERDWL